MNDSIRESFRSAYGWPPKVVARAPGRIEFIGNHTDYNGGPVLGAAIDRSVTVAVAPREDGIRRLTSDDVRSTGRIEIAAGPFAKRSGASSWTNYPLGVVEAMSGSGLVVPAGFDFLATSDLPAGAGLSSSAAIELASALCFLSITGQEIPPEQLAALGRRAENEFVGVPCGILDQGVSAFGRENHLVHIDCREEKFSHVPLPVDVSFWVFNTHSKHALVDGLYATRHKECMDAAAALGVGLLADASIEMLDAAKGGMPANIAKRARHVISEIARVREVAAALGKGEIARVGELMVESHRSSQRLFENSTGELDLLVDLLVDVPSVHGARLTGGGFGGAVLALTAPDFDQCAADKIAASFAARFGKRPEIIPLRTGDGARILSDG